MNQHPINTNESQQMTANESTTNESRIESSWT